DDGGHLLSFARMDGAKLSSINIAIVKATAAATRRKATGPAGEPAQPNVLLSMGLAIGGNGQQTPIRRGVPLEVGGGCVGAIGVSNGSEDQDVDCAQAGTRALSEL